MRDPLTLQAALLADASRFDFFAALRLLECAHPQQPRIGASLKPQDDALRFGQSPSLAFAPGVVDRLEPGHEGRPMRLLLNSFGLLGPNGPLPTHISEYVRDRLRNSADPTLARFLDLFHHRLISLFYRAWASAQPTVSMDRPEADRFADYLASLIGMGMPALRNRDTVADVSRLHYAGQLAGHNRNAAGLASVLASYMQMPVSVEQFVGHWMALPDDGKLYLRGHFGGQALGQGTVLGRQIWNRQHKFRLRIGPLDFAQFQRLLPGGDSLQRLTDLVRHYVGDALAWDINIVLQKDQVPPLRLGKRARLGRTTWLGKKPRQRDADQLFLTPLSFTS